MDTKLKAYKPNPQKGFVVQRNASENFGLASPALLPIVWLLGSLETFPRVKSILQLPAQTGLRKEEDADKQEAAGGGYAERRAASCECRGDDADEMFSLWLLFRKYYASGRISGSTGGRLWHRSFPAINAHSVIRGTHRMKTMKLIRLAGYFTLTQSLVAGAPVHVPECQGQQLWV